MRFRLRSRTPQVFRRSCVIATLLLAIVSLGVGARAWLDSRQEASPQAVGSSVSLLQDTRSDRIEAEVITLTPTGFDRKEVTRRSGDFLLAVSNRSGLEEVLLRLDRIGGNRMQEQRLSKKRRAWRETKNLPAGQYILSEANNPDWVCQITITDE